MTSQGQPTVRKAVIPAAGLGTRFLPSTKAIPKEMLPVVDKPAIQYVVEEAERAGLHDILMVTGRNKAALEDHFDRHWELEQALERKGDQLRLQRVRKSANLGNVHFIRQGEPLGLGHAVLCARTHVGDSPFAVLLGDDLIDERDCLLERMIRAQQTYGGSVVALMEVPEDQIHLYGCAAVSPVPGAGDTADGDVVRVDTLVEKPAVGDAPSNLAIIGRYVLAPQIFDVLDHTAPGRGGEIQLTDALREMAQDPHRDGGGVTGVVFHGRRYDTGDRLDYLKAMVRLAVRHRDFGAEFRGWLMDWVDSDEGRGKRPHAEDDEGEHLGH
ncbi:UTP--glucose-1-phosphate uridylyltransferase GalU [Flexivirga caeni]|uniref:UTP--glucose-1-phosphate uridylyltransferase n=1 Tax=Flexivirga caeni TaxID=2294115 RepID=A0A3M9ME94_9MICO|nr:UTP--glucose-1-phosphate uridylyltransferase GalU [Flexivirga caeni]RNI23886.1 UTP--glucose-1-phosphate uridylyltransferase [Flexivirga caeni]